MSVSVKLSDLYDACEWVSSDASAGMYAEAYINRATGQIHWSGDGIDEELPDDVDDDDLYIVVPDKREFASGRTLALAFTDKHLPGSSRIVREYFSKRGAFRRFTSLLEREDQLGAWHRFEEAAIENALSEWCTENGFTATRTTTD